MLVMGCVWGRRKLKIHDMTPSSAPRVVCRSHTPRPTSLALPFYRPASVRNASRRAALSATGSDRFSTVVNV